MSFLESKVDEKFPEKIQNYSNMLFPESKRKLLVKAKIKNKTISGHHDKNARDGNVVTCSQWEIDTIDNIDQSQRRVF